MVSAQPDASAYDVSENGAISPAWWHVSGYADYDLDVARRLGLTTVFVARPHARPGAADHQVSDLAGLADLVASMPA